MNSSDSSGSVLSQSCELAGQVQPAADRPSCGGPATAAARLASRALAAWMTRCGDRVADALVLEQEVFEPGPDHRLDQRADLGVVQPVLGLPLELRLVDADREDRGQRPRGCPRSLISRPFLTSSCVSMNFWTAVPTALRSPCSWVPPSRVGIVLTNERMSSSVASVQVSARIEPEVVVLAFQDERRRGDPRRPRGRVDRVEEVGDARRRGGTRRSSCAFSSTNWMARPLFRYVFTSSRSAISSESKSSAGEDLGVGREGDGRAGAPDRLALLDRAVRLASPVALDVGHAVATDLGGQALAQRVDDAGADAVQAAGDLVGVVVELAAGVQAW